MTRKVQTLGRHTRGSRLLRNSEEILKEMRSHSPVVPHGHFSFRLKGGGEVRPTLTLEVVREHIPDHLNGLIAAIDDPDIIARTARLVDGEWEYMVVYYKPSKKLELA